MYVHKHQLEHLLRPRHYYDERQYQTEVERLFLPGWHLAGSRADLPHSGDFLTIELFGWPVLVRNIDGEIHAFLNVCAHRHCMLTHQPRGHDPRLRCQYHGWEYTKEGRTGKIPDAGCFRPFDRDRARLRKFRVATCGELVFVSLAEDGPSLEEHLGGFFPKMAESFGPPFRQVWRWEYQYAANWKVPVENTLEMYHLPCLHAKTLSHYREEKYYTHVLGDRCSTLHTTEYHPWVTRIQNWMLRRLGVRPTNTYVHHLVYPNTVFIGQDSMRLTEQFVPTGPATAVQRVRVYGIRGTRNNPLARLIARLMRFSVLTITRRILTEDLPIFAQVQRGLQSSPHPGVLGTLEERVHRFQKYILETCGDATAPNV